MFIAKVPSMHYLIKPKMLYDSHLELQLGEAYAPTPYEPFVMWLRYYLVDYE